MRIFISLVVLLCAFLPAHAAERPHLVFIYADDLGYGDLSHGGGRATTPHCDRLAREGMRFTDAHSASAVCTPRRYAVLTGRYSWRTHLKNGVLWGMSKPLIPPGRSTVASFLAESGYHTAVVGKWHLGLGWKMLPDGQTRQAETGATKGGGWDVDYTQPVTEGPGTVGFDESMIIPASLDMEPYVDLRNPQPTEVPTLPKAFHSPGPAPESFDPEGWNTLTLSRDKDFVQVWLNGEELYRVRVTAPRPGRLSINLSGPAGTSLQIREVNVAEVPSEDQ